MSSTEAGDETTSSGQHDDDLDMTDPEDFGTLTVEDTAADESDLDPSSQASPTDD